MSQRLLNNTKWIWCLLATMWGPGWNPVSSVTVKTPKVPGTVEAQAKFFQDFFSVQLSPYKIEFGHVCEDPNTWEQRYEKKDFKSHRDMGKVRWGDKEGGYGEHYWDLNHAGSAHNHVKDDSDNNEDDSSYNEAPYNEEYKVHSDDPYNEPSDQNPSYNSEYDAERSAKYEESNRAKRAHPKIQGDVEEVRTLNKRKTNDEPTENENTQKKTQIRRHNHKQKEQQQEESNQRDDINNQQQQQAEQSQNVRATLEHYVPYEGGAGVRTHYPPEVTLAASAPRLFLEPTTGHVVDRATGQAYILQPIVAHFN